MAWGEGWTGNQWWCRILPDKGPVGVGAVRCVWECVLCMLYTHMVHMYAYMQKLMADVFLTEPGFHQLG